MTNLLVLLLVASAHAQPSFTKRPYKEVNLAGVTVSGYSKPKAVPSKDEDTWKTAYRYLFGANYMDDPEVLKGQSAWQVVKKRAKAEGMDAWDSEVEIALDPKQHSKCLVKMVVDCSK